MSIAMQVAEQQGKYLAAALNADEAATPKPFAWKSRGAMATLGTPLLLTPKSTPHTFSICGSFPIT